MKTIKVIDLLNKIANGEELPLKIKYEKHIYEYEEGTYDWSYYIQNNGTIKFLLTDVFNSNDNILNILNNEVEIIKEEKKLPEKIRGGYAIWEEQARDIDYEFKNTINQLIDYLESKEKGDE